MAEENTYSENQEDLLKHLYRQSFDTVLRLPALRLHLTWETSVFCLPANRLCFCCVTMKRPLISGETFA